MDKLQFKRFTLIIFSLRTYAFKIDKEDRLFIKLCILDGMESKEILELYFDTIDTF